MTRGRVGKISSVARVHASCVLVGRRAVLVRGVSGSGKSSLVLALLSHDGPRRPVRLVADDAVDLVAAGRRVVAIAPEPTAGLIEARGVGLIPVATERRALIGLVVDLEPASSLERLPEPAEARVELVGVSLPRLVLPVHAWDNPGRILAALDSLAGDEVFPVLPGDGSA